MPEPVDPVLPELVDGGGLLLAPLSPDPELEPPLLPEEEESELVDLFESAFAAFL